MTYPVGGTVLQVDGIKDIEGFVQSRDRGESPIGRHPPGEDEDIWLPVDDYAQNTTTTGKVAVGGTLTGFISEAADRDWIAVELEAGKTYQIDVLGSSSGDGTLDDPVLYGIFDSSGWYIRGTSDDDGGMGRNSLLWFTPKTSGTYYVAVRVFYEWEGRFDRYDVRGTYKVAVEEIPGPSGDLPSSTETTGTVAVGGETRGRSDWNGDTDWFAVELEAGTTYQIDTKGETTDHNGRPLSAKILGIHDSSGTVIDGTSGKSFNYQEVFTPSVSGTYYVSVQGSSVGIYRVSVEPLPASSDEARDDAQPDGGGVVGSDITGTAAADTLDGTSGADVMDGLAGNDVMRGLAGDDRLWGRLDADTLHGNSGNDRLWGGKGRDELHGGTGKDHLYGGKGDDELYGGRHADRLHGGKGEDLLSGGHGRDVFVYDDRDFGRDRIVDFEDGMDLLNFKGSGLEWSDLSISNNNNGHAVVRVNGSDSQIVLRGVDASLIGQDDFIF